VPAIPYKSICNIKTHIKVKITMKLNIGTSQNIVGGCLQGELTELEKGRIY
jgi:hypothetical protein